MWHSQIMLAVEGYTKMFKKKSLFITLHKNIIDDTTYQIKTNNQMEKLWKNFEKSSKNGLHCLYIPPDYACVFELTLALRNFWFHKKNLQKLFCTMLGKNEWYVSIGSGYILYHDFWSYNLQYFISKKILTTFMLGLHE